MFISLFPVRSVLPCIPGLPSKHLSHMMTAMIQLFYLTILAAVIPRLIIIKMRSRLQGTSCFILYRLYAKSWIDSFLPKGFTNTQGNGEDGDKRNGESQKMLHEAPFRWWLFHVVCNLIDLRNFQYYLLLTRDTYYQDCIPKNYE